MVRKPKRFDGQCWNNGLWLWLLSAWKKPKLNKRAKIPFITSLRRKRRNLENPEENRVHKDCAMEGKTGKLFFIDGDDGGGGDGEYIMFVT